MMKSGETMMSRKFIAILVVASIGFSAGMLYGAPRHAFADSDAPDTAQADITVQEGHLKRMTMRQYVDGYGVIAPAPATAQTPAAEANVAAAVTGVVTKVEVTEGQTVQRGQILALLNSDSMTEQYAAQEVDRLKTLYAHHNASLKTLQNAEAQLALLQVTAPFTGTVVSVNVKPGAAVTPTTVLADIMDLDRLVVRADIPAQQAAQLAVGQPVDIQGPPPVSAQLSYISPTVDPKDGAVMVWAALPTGHGFKVGQYVRLHITTAVHKDSLVAPDKSVIRGLGGKGVLSVIHGNEADQVRVQVGLHENGWIEVSGSGLKEGTPVVTTGAYGLPAHTSIQIENAQ